MSPAAPHRCPTTGLDHAPDRLSCRPCVLEKRTLAVITDREGRVNEHLRPLRDHLIATLTVESINNWARLSTSARLIRSLANRDIEVSHYALDSFVKAMMFVMPNMSALSSSMRDCSSHETRSCNSSTSGAPTTYPPPAHLTGRCSNPSCDGTSARSYSAKRGKDH